MWCSEQCKFLYECIEGVCEHKNFWPPAFVELIGILLTGIFSSFASLAGRGGRCIMVSIFIQFFNYLEKEAVLIIFVPVFGASLGNLFNLINQVDPQSREPIVNVRRAIISCPMMIVGSIIGILMNKFLLGFYDFNLKIISIVSIFHRCILGIFFTQIVDKVHKVGFKRNQNGK